MEPLMGLMALPSSYVTSMRHPFLADGGVLRRDHRLRRGVGQVPQDDPLGLLRILPAALHGEHLRPPHRLLEGRCSIVHVAI